MSELQKVDPAIWEIIKKEEQRQQGGLELIASENYASAAVMEAQGSVLTNKYAEGYPGKRYYGGCENVDEIEKLALDRLKALFGSERANVQPHSGAQANTAVFLAALQPGDTFLGLDLAHGGHLTHGMKLNLSGKYFKPVGYGVDPKTHRIDYDQLARLAHEHHPKMIIAGASAYPREIDFARIAEIAHEVKALFMVDMAHIAGIVAAKRHMSPVPYAQFVTSTTHKTLRGPRGGFILCNEEWGQKINSSVFPGVQGGPLMHVIAAKAVAFHEALSPSYVNYIDQVLANAKTMAEELQRYGFPIVSGGTDNHLMLVDVWSKGVSGKVAEHALDQAGITINKNMIPFDTRPPMDPSGIRIGTPALTTRGMRESEMKQIAKWISQALQHHNEPEKIQAIRKEVFELCQAFPAPARLI
jgi:glycine hydroxymethyltransferase